MSLSFTSIEQNHVDSLLKIEQICHSHPWNEKTFRSCIGGRYFGYYATLHNEIIGFYIGETVSDESTLMDICVDPKYQGAGYGKHLLLHMIEQAKLRNAHKLFLEVRAKNIGALMMYINCGFIEVSRRTGYYPSAIGYEDAIVMEKKL